MPTSNDYSAIWGGGIGFDLNNSGGANPVKAGYNAPMNKVIGFSFDIDAVPIGGIRVEIPTMATVATSHFKTISTAGHHTVLISEVKQGSWVTPVTAIDPPRSCRSSSTSRPPCPARFPTSSAWTSSPP